MQKKKTHEDMRGSVCGVCWLKPKGLRNISPPISSQIRAFVYPDYNLDDVSCWLPKVICDGCRKSLRDTMIYFKYNSITLYFCRQKIQIMQ